MNALIYLRISQDRTGQEAGVDRQREDCLRRAEERGWKVVVTETDNDISASGKRKRPGFEAMLAALEAGTVQVVIAWSLDRLQRNRRDEVRLYELCQAKGARLSLVNGTELDFQSAAGRFVADSLGSVARFEIELKSDRQRRAQQQAAEQGRRVGGRRPFGYEADGVTVREREAAAIREGYAAFLAGVPLAEIARSWNAAGLTTAQANRAGEPSPWAAYSVRMVLKNARNMGKRSYNGEVVADAVWPAIVEEGTWRAVNDVLSHPERRRAPRSAQFLLSGLAVCGVCGSTLHAGGTKRAGVRAYRCSGSTGHVSRMAEPVDEYVEAVVVGILSRPDAVGLLRDTKRPDVDGLQVEALSVRQRLDSVAVDFADGALTAAQLRTITTRLRTRLEELEASMADAGRVDVLGPLVRAEHVRETWDALAVSRKRAVIDLLATVTVLPPGRGTRTFRPETVLIEPRPM